MIPDTIADEYPLRITTGETLQIAELDDERSPALADKHVQRICKDLLNNCTYISRKDMEDAKAGFDIVFLKALRASPQGCMIKSPYVCRLIHDCAMANQSICTLENISERRPLPICWEFAPRSVSKNLKEEESAAIDLGTVIGHAWRRGFYVIIVGS